MQLQRTSGVEVDKDGIGANDVGDSVTGVGYCRLQCSLIV